MLQQNILCEVVQLVMLDSNFFWLGQVCTLTYQILISYKTIRILAKSSMVTDMWYHIEYPIFDNLYCNQLFKIMDYSYPITWPASADGLTDDDQLWKLQHRFWHRKIKRIERVIDRPIFHTVQRESWQGRGTFHVFKSVFRHIWWPVYTDGHSRVTRTITLIPLRQPHNINLWEG